MATKAPSRKSKASSFVLELPLRVSPTNEEQLNTMFFASQQVYNACLGEALNRLKLLRDSRAYRAALRLPKGAARTRAFSAAREAVGFTEYALHTYFNQRVRKNWIRAHVSSPVGQNLATRAFNAVDQHALGLKGRPRFKGKGQVNSIEGKSNESAVLWRDDSEVRILKMVLPAVIPSKDEVVEAALQRRVKHVRLVRRGLRGETRFYAQLVLEGKPIVKKEHAQRAKNAAQKTAFDLGPSTLAVVGTTHAELLQFLPELPNYSRRIRVLQRRLDRSRRATNPTNYNPDGTVKPGRHAWIHSNRYRKARGELAELQRRVAEYRKTQHGELSNRILQHGSIINTENISLRAWQKLFGRSIRDRAPGVFMGLVTRKAESAGGRINLISTRSTALSQHCVCGRKEKKPLSQRTHNCQCGVIMQRDLMAAYLALHTDTTTTPHVLHADKARVAYQGAEPLLRAAWQHATQPANGRKLPSTFGTPRSQSGSPEQDQAPIVEAQHDVPDQIGEGLGETKSINLVRTPSL